MGIRDWSAVPSDNGSKPGIIMSEGMAPRDVNNSVRQIMADVASARLIGSSATTAGLAAVNTTLPLALSDEITKSGLFAYDSRIPVAYHQSRGRRARFVAPNAAAVGAWYRDGGVVRSRDIGMSPSNTGADNFAAWNIFRDEMQTLQDRQEPRALTFVWDEDEFTIAGGLYLAWYQQNLQMDGRGAVITGAGLMGTYNGSVNPLQNTRIRDITVKNAPQDGIRLVNAPYTKLTKTTVINPALNGYNIWGSNNHKLDDVTAMAGGATSGAAAGILAQTLLTSGGAVAPMISCTILTPDIQGFSAGVLGYDVQDLKVIDGTVQISHGGSNGGCGVRIEGGRKIHVQGVHFEQNDIDFYVVNVNRVGPVLAYRTYRLIDNDFGSGNTSVQVASDITGFVIDGGWISGSVLISTTGTTGSISAGTDMPLPITNSSPAFYDRAYPFPVIADIAGAPTGADFNNLLNALRQKGVITRTFI